MHYSGVEKPKKRVFFMMSVCVYVRTYVRLCTRVQPKRLNGMFSNFIYKMLMLISRIDQLLGKIGPRLRGAAIQLFWNQYEFLQNYNTRRMKITYGWLYNRTSTYMKFQNVKVSFSGCCHTAFRTLLTYLQNYVNYKVGIKSRKVN